MTDANISFKIGLTVSDEFMAALHSWDWMFEFGDRLLLQNIFQLLAAKTSNRVVAVRMELN